MNALRSRTSLIVSLSLFCLLVVSPGKRSLAITGADPQLQYGEFIPTGVSITPTAAKGSTFQPLNPDLSSDPAFTAGQAVTTAISPDGKTLLILTSGYNSQNFASGPNMGKTNPDESNEYIFVYNIAGPAPLKLQVLKIPNAFDGLVWNPSGKEFYASGGTDDTVHVFVAGPSGWVEDPKSPIMLGHAKKVTFGQIAPAAAGIAVTANGTKLVVANYENDSISVVDIPSRVKVDELDLRPGNGLPGGEYPFWVAIKGSDTAFVSSERDREVVAVNISGVHPLIAHRIHLKGQPIRLILNDKQTRLYVTEATSDSVAVIDSSSYQMLEEISTTAPSSVFENRRHYKGSSPNSLALSPDQNTLYVTNGGANSLAVIRLASNDQSTSSSQRSELIGLIPTGWYPNSVSASADGLTLYVVNGKSNAGPNPQACVDKASIAPGGSSAACSGVNQYVWQLTKAGFLTVPVPPDQDLELLTEQVAQNNAYLRDRDRNRDDRLIRLLRQKIQHVIYIVKENRTYDQILGDLEKGNGDPSITVYPQAFTPNQHRLASRFVDLDNFYDSGEVSGDGWNWSTAARAADTIEKTEPINYAGRGLAYDYEGTNRNINVGLGTIADRHAANPLTPSDPNLLPGPADVSAPDSPEGQEGAGYLWDSALRAGLSVRNYGFFIDLTRYSPGSALIPLIKDPYAMGTQVSFPTKAALQDITDPYFRGYDNAFPDFYRVNEWLREFNQFEQDGNLPNLEFVRVMHDHTGSFSTALDGVNTPEIQTADNDYAVGRIVEAVSHSDQYKDNTLIFVVEDDAQDGPDHVDAHRSIALIAGAYVKRGADISRRYTTVNTVSTIVDILGIEHLGLNDADAIPMADCFRTKPSKWTFDAIIPDILTTTQLPLPLNAKNVVPSSRRIRLADSQRPLHDASWWAEKTRGFDFSAEDKVDAARYNRILWEGLMGENVPYPSVRSGRDLRQNRQQLLQKYRKNQKARLSAARTEIAERDGGLSFGTADAGREGGQ